MKILVVKLTSLGDAIHLLPALSDLQTQFPEARVDWMIEDSFSEIPLWHSSVDRVIPVSTRRWRKLNMRNLREFVSFVTLLRSQSYDLIIDAQGLMKSALLARFARRKPGGKRLGFSADSIKEKFAARLYAVGISVAREQHAIVRLRKLFSGGMAYDLPDTKPVYAINYSNTDDVKDFSNTLLFFPSTTWVSKHLPDQLWRDLVGVALDNGYRVQVCWGNNREKTRAEWIVQGHKNASLMAKSTLNQIAQALDKCVGAIAVDTGLAHLAAALAIPTVSIYGATDARLTGALGDKQIHLQCQYPCSPCLRKTCDKLSERIAEPPCYLTLSADDIWQALFKLIG